MILVSACLLGKKTKYDGGSNPQELLKIYDACGRFLPFCPEALGNLSIPRPPAEIFSGTGQDVWQKNAIVKNKNEEDVTESFLAGAKAAQELVKVHQVKYAILKENSPSCGVHSIYDGTFSRKKIKGEGVAAAALAEAGVTLYSEMDLSPDLIERLIREDEK